MSLMITLTGPRASGKTTTARKLAGDDAFKLQGKGLAIKTNWSSVPTDRNWQVEGEGMDKNDLRVLQAIAEGRGPWTGPELIVVDNAPALVEEPVSARPKKALADMLPHERRVVEEHAELLAKTEQRDLFQASDTWLKLPDEERRRLDRQLTYMQLYVNVLQERIEAF
jgi:hypothetical protein